MATTNIFKRLKNGERINSDDQDGYKLREASSATRKLLRKMNNAEKATEVRHYLSPITETKLDEVWSFSHLCISITGKTSSLLKMSLSIFAALS